jgi:hypothetical protein
MKILLLIFAAFLAGCGPSDELKATASEACSDFILESQDLKYGGETNIFDIYTKNDKLVIEVGYRRRETTKPYSVRLCVYDEESQRILLPGLLNQSEWAKN